MYRIFSAFMLALVLVSSQNVDLSGTYASKLTSPFYKFVFNKNKI